MASYLRDIREKVVLIWFPWQLSGHTIVDILVHAFGGRESQFLRSPS
jgi:hypothetical protein